MPRQRLIINGKKFYQHPVFTNYASGKDGEIINFKTGKIIKPQLNNRGYNLFSICDKSLDKPKSYSCQRFIVETIRGVIPEGFEIDHINNCKIDNRVKNLQILTKKQNIENSKNKAIVSINIESGEEKYYISIKSASIELNIGVSEISSIFLKRKYHKTATSKNDGNKYRFEFVK